VQVALATQSADPVQLVLQVLPPHKKGAQSLVTAVWHVPLPSQLRAGE
jgi:hypothetical protein